MSIMDERHVVWAIFAHSAACISVHALAYLASKKCSVVTLSVRMSVMFVIIGAIGAAAET